MTLPPTGECPTARGNCAHNMGGFCIAPTHSILAKCT